MGGVIGKISGSLNVPGGIASKLGKILEGGDQRDAFNGILLATVAHVNNKSNFNIEVEINDLLIRLSNLRGAQGGLGGIMTKISHGLFENIDKTMSGMLNNK
jgi:hypothetical protein